MIEDRPEQWGTPLKDYYEKWIAPLAPIVCQMPGCKHPTIEREEYCTRHLLEQEIAFQQWLDWKEEQGAEE